MKDLKEEQLASDQLLDGKLLKVYRDQVLLPDGEESEREWIDHPGAAAVVPLFEDGKTLLLRQFRYAAGKTFLEVPAGKLDEKDEDPREVAARELEEETGWRAERFTHLGALHPCIGYSNEIIHFFLAEDLSQGEQDLQEGEFVEVVTMGLQEIIVRSRKGEVLDMKSLSALTLADHYLRQREEEVREKKLR